jgi:hypothetical protein
MFAVSAGGAMAAADAGFAAQIDNWSVVALVNSCYAFDRPPEEYNQSPWNSLTIHAPKAGGFSLEVFFWPGLFEDGASYRLSVHPEAGDAHVIDSNGVGDAALQSRGLLPDELVNELRTGRLLTVRTADVRVTLAFDTSRVSDVLTALDGCRHKIGGN